MGVTPKIPDTIWSSAGQIPVRKVKELKAEDGSPLMGLYDALNRVILLRAGMAPAAQWQTLRHEQVHAVLFDAGVVLTEEHEERICDVIAAAWVSEDRRKWASARRMK